mmetsp:Transcript_17030/g.40613  ORF Transcript_17030/g.40613 Transcript_17030/m.40613 type:complete len:265 (+) Transcript_17030:2320-3114(+)
MRFTEVEQISDVVQVVRYGRVIPAARGVPGQTHGQVHAAHLRVALVQVAGDAGQQLGQMPVLHQCLFEFRQLDAQHLALRDRAAQMAVGLLQPGNPQGKVGRMNPQQHFCEVMQQGRAVDDGGIGVGAVGREAQRIAGRPFGALHHPRQAEQRLFMVGQHGLQRGLWPEVPEEGSDAHQHQSGRHGLGVGHQPPTPEFVGMGQHLERHQRVGRDHLGQAVGIDVILGRAHQLQRLGGLGQHRDFRPGERRDPGVKAGQRSGQAQ